MSQSVEAESDLGALSSNLPASQEGGAPRYYLSTAIAYTNGHPHMGHAYEFVLADALVRYHRVFGHDTYFLTGSDEHGQKVAASAEKSGRTPLEHCDFYVNSFKNLNRALGISCSRYIRTTDPQHEATAKELWVKCAAKGDIYLDTYEGWYNEREECFVTDMEAEAAGFMDVGSGLPLKRVKEESYFFRMSNYQERLIAYIEANPKFVQPEQFRNNILARLRKDALKDLSISRTSFSWGVRVPEGFSAEHVMYVWFDALSNYLSGVHALESEHPLSRFWPAQHQIVGKDIIWFHCVIWPCMLMSADLPLPESVATHGFVNAADGRKMSKSYENTVDPNEILAKYGSDSLRYYFISSTSYGADLNFSEDSLVSMHNSELADTLGNLVHRGVNLCIKYCDGKIPDVPHDPQFGLPFDLAALEAGVRADLEACAMNSAIFKGMEAVRATNRFLTEAEPWKMKGEGSEIRRVAVVRTTLEAIFAFTHYLAPVIPNAAAAIFRKLGTQPIPTNTLSADFYNLKPGTGVFLGDILYQKIINDDASGAAQQAIASAAAASAKKAEKKGGGKPAAAVAEEAENPNQIDFTKIELRVGKIMKVWNHETADRLYCEEIDVKDADGTRRPVVSGLRAHYSLEEMEGRLVVVVCNLKEAKMQGFISRGMVLAAKSPEGKVELIDPPVGAEVGELLELEGFARDGPVWQAAKVKKMKVWEKVSELLRTDADGNATWDGKALVTSAGRCKAATLGDSPIS